MKVLVTGAAGFIGYHVSSALMKRGDEVVGVDNFNEYYDVRLKEARSKMLVQRGAVMRRMDVAHESEMAHLCKSVRPDKVCHLAAQAGVRYSMENPLAYVDANERGFVSVLEAARRNGVRDVVFASSSSVYGGQQKVPFVESGACDRPISVYAASKRANELAAHVYSSVHGMHLSGLRFFTVYGPWGRPDMALFTFARRMMRGEPIDVFNGGEMHRDFTYIDDIVAGVVAALDRPRPYELFNIGRGEPVKLTSFIECIERELGVKAERRNMPLQPGDVPRTWADVSKARDVLGYDPSVSIDEGVQKFCEWFVSWNAKD